MTRHRASVNKPQRGNAKAFSRAAVMTLFISLGTSFTFAQTPNETSPGDTKTGDTKTGDTNPDNTAEPLTSSGPFLGRSSCAASTCHGGVIGRGPAWRHALTRWVADDPHLAAGLVLWNELSETMVTTLDPTIGELQSSEASLPPEQQTWRLKRDQLLRRRCISCHVTVTAADCQSQEPLAATTLARGVSCESCHGAAESWYSEHLSKDFVGVRRWDLGMHDTESILGRADGCVRCHVGSRTEDGLVRDMNHDLIAAGHPALRFDLSLYEAALPPHWDPASSPAFDQSPIRVRRVGRASSLAAAAWLTAQRAKDHLAEREREVAPASRRVPLPELSDYDCFACHQSLSMDQYLVPVGEGTSDLAISAGLPIWNSWHSVSQLTLKKDYLKVLAPQHFDAEQASRLAGIGNQLGELYHQKAGRYQQQEFDAVEELRRIADELKLSDDWHLAAIHYLDLEAALRELAEEDEKYKLLHRQLVSDVQPLLRFGSGLHSPQTYDLDASARFQAAVQQLLKPNSP